MLDNETFIEVGYIRKGHGYQGHARIVIFDGWERDMAEQEFLFIEIDGYKVPFAIEERVEHKGTIIKLEYIDSVEQLKSFHKKSIFLLSKDIKYNQTTVVSQIQFSNHIGLHIHDKRLGDLGPIIRIDEYPQQEMAVIKDSKGKDVLIPLHPSLIIEKNIEKGIIKMDLPEGLV